MAVGNRESWGGDDRTGRRCRSVDHYRSTLDEMRQVGYAAFAARQLSPYVRAAATQFSPQHRTWTERLLDRVKGLRKR